MDKTSEQLIIDWLGRIDAKIELSQGELFRRINLVEIAQAEGKGRLAVTMLIIGIAVSVLFQWIGKQL